MKRKLILCVFEGSFLFYVHGQTVKAKARAGAALGQTESYWQTEKLAHYNTGYAYSICFAKRTRQWAKLQLAERFLSFWPEAKN